MEQSRGSPDKSIATCPFNKITQATLRILQRARGILGLPKLQYQNRFGSVLPGAVIGFLQDFRGMTEPGDIKTPEQVAPYEANIYRALYGMPPSQYRVMKQQGIESGIVPSFLQGEDTMSILAGTMCVEFLVHYKREVDSPDRDIGGHFYRNSILLFQNFDAVFLTATQLARSKEEWHNMKEGMRKTTIHLAMMGAGPQESLTNNLKRVIHSDHLGSNEYVLKIAHKLAENDYIGSIRNNLQSTIQMSGGYGYCPAIKDGTLLEAFEIMFQIYTKLIINPKFESGKTDS